LRAVARSCLCKLKAQLHTLVTGRVKSGEPAVEDDRTRVHLEDCLREVKLILDPKE
jgi:hypothetical protein